MTTQATEAMRAVRDQFGSAKAFPGVKSHDLVSIFVTEGPRRGLILGSAATKDEAWLNAAAGLEGRG